MLKDLSSHPQDQFAPECSASDHYESDGRDMERGGAQFRASLWLGIAADLRRERTTRGTKGQVSC